MAVAFRGSKATLDQPNERWSRTRILDIEALQEAVFGAGLDAVQLSRGPVQGSLAFASDDQITYSSGLVEGHVALSGPLSETMVTLGVGINLAPGSRQWMKEVKTGGIGVFLAGDEHEALYVPGAIYACVTLSSDHLEEIAADMDLVLNARELGGSGISPREVPRNVLATLQRGFGRLHRGRSELAPDPRVLGRYTLQGMISVLAREPRALPGRRDRSGHGRIVARAQSYILEHLDRPLSVSAIARAAFASQATLYRAFHEVLDETPQSFVRKLRLNRIRRDLATLEERLCTVTVVANRWGMSELGRFAGWYREFFGELPSHTLARRMAELRSNQPVAGNEKIGIAQRSAVPTL